MTNHFSLNLSSSMPNREVSHFEAMPNGEKNVQWHGSQMHCNDQAPLEFQNRKPSVLNSIASKVSYGAPTLSKTDYNSKMKSFCKIQPCSQLLETSTIICNNDKDNLCNIFGCYNCLTQSASSLDKQTYGGYNAQTPSPLISPLYNSVGFPPGNNSCLQNQKIPLNGSMIKTGAQPQFRLHMNQFPAPRGHNDNYPATGTISHCEQCSPISYDSSNLNHEPFNNSEDVYKQNNFVKSSVSLPSQYPVNEPYQEQSPYFTLQDYQQQMVYPNPKTYQQGLSAYFPLQHYQQQDYYPNNGAYEEKQFAYSPSLHYHNQSLNSNDYNQGIYCQAKEFTQNGHEGHFQPFSSYDCNSYNLSNKQHDMSPVLLPNQKRFISTEQLTATDNKNLPTEGAVYASSGGSFLLRSICCNNSTSRSSSSRLSTRIQDGYVEPPSIPCFKRNSNTQKAGKHATTLKTAEVTMLKPKVNLQDTSEENLPKAPEIKQKNQSESISKNIDQNCGLVDGICNLSEKPHIPVKFRILHRKAEGRRPLDNQSGKLKPKNEYYKAPQPIQLEESDNKICFKVYQVINKNDVEPKRLVAYATKELPISPLTEFSVSNEDKALPAKNKLEMPMENENIQNQGTTTNEVSGIETLSNATMIAPSWLCCPSNSNDEIASDIADEEEGLDKTEESLPEYCQRFQNENDLRWQLIQQDPQHSYNLNQGIYQTVIPHQNKVFYPPYVHNQSKEDMIPSRQPFLVTNLPPSLIPSQQQTQNFRLASIQQQFSSEQPFNSHLSFDRTQPHNSSDVSSQDFVDSYSAPPQGVATPPFQYVQPYYPDYSFCLNKKSFFPYANTVKNTRVYQNLVDNNQTYQYKKPETTNNSWLCCKSASLSQHNSRPASVDNTIEENSEETERPKNKEISQINKDSQAQKKEEIFSSLAEDNVLHTAEENIDKTSEVKNVVQSKVINVDRKINKEFTGCCRYYSADTSVISDETLIYTEPAKHQRKKPQVSQKKPLQEAAKKPMKAKISVKTFHVKDSPNKHKNLKQEKAVSLEPVPESINTALSADADPAIATTPQSSAPPVQLELPKQKRRHFFKKAVVTINPPIEVPRTHLGFPELYSNAYLIPKQDLPCKRGEAVKASTGLEKAPSAPHFPINKAALNASLIPQQGIMYKEVEDIKRPVKFEYMEPHKTIHYHILKTSPALLSCLNCCNKSSINLTPIISRSLPPKIHSVQNVDDLFSNNCSVCCGT